MNIIKNPNFNFIGKRKIMYIFSIVVIIWGMITFGIRGRKNFGVDFTGGDMLQVEISVTADVVSIRDKLGGLNIGNYTVQRLGEEGKGFIIKSNPDTSDAIADKLRESFGAGNVMVEAKSVVSPSMSVTLRKKALYAFLLGILGILFYLTFRFEFRFAVGATLAIFHDLLFVLAVLAITRQQIDSSVIAAFLTVAGYSVNDTVVVFDRIRENIRRTKNDDYPVIFNGSINETLSRTLLTLLTTLFVVGCLFIFGGEPLRVFSFVLLVGFTVGTYSSIFMASSILVDWHRIKPYKFRI
jgi:preprotein translocase SecF subunit